MNARPLISFSLGCYNQAAYIREALEAALAQTYSPLEIIISDDASTDRSFEILQQTVAAYTGPHAVKLNRNQSNLGIGGNVNRMMKLCQGELVVIAAGDDVSLPERTEIIYQAWEKFGHRPTSISSSYRTIAADGTELGLGGLRGDPKDTRPFQLQTGDFREFLTHRQPVVCGCSHAWSPELFRYFGPLKTDLEDLVLSFRTLAIGQMLYIRQPLVKYRRHGSNVSFFAGKDDTHSFEHRENRLRWIAEQTVRAYDNLMADVEILHQNGQLTRAERERLLKAGRRVQTVYAVERQLIDGNGLKRLSTLTDALGRGNFHCGLRFLPRLLPRTIYQALYEFKNRKPVSLRT